MNTMDNSEKLIQKLREKQMKPIPRWRFILKNLINWAVFITSVLLGALAFSVVLFSIQQVDFNLVAGLSYSWLTLLLGLLPFFWIIALVVFLVTAIIGIRNSKKGYKFTAMSLAGFSVAFSILLGTLFFISGGGHWLEHAFASRVGIYESIEERKVKLWVMPEEGYLAGTVEGMQGDEISLLDFRGDSWTVEYLDADMPPAVVLEKGARIKIVGEILEPGKFKANMIRPWGGEARFRKMKGKNERKP